MIRWIALWMVALVAASPAVADDRDVGYVKVRNGEAWIERDGATLDAAPGTLLRVDDVCVTGADGALGVTLLDNGRVSLGPDSRFSVTSFAFDPAHAEVGFVGRLFGGTMEFISGLIAKLAPGSATIETPVANIVVRGTRILVRAEAP